MINSGSQFVVHMFLSLLSGETIFQPFQFLFLSLHLILEIEVVLVSTLQLYNLFLQSDIIRLYDGDIVGWWNLEQNQCFNF